MPDQTLTMEKPRARFWFLFSCVASAGMFLVIAVASCTSVETFGRIYSMVTEFLSLSRTTLSANLRASPNLGHFVCYALLSLSLSGVLSRRNRYAAPLVAVVFGIVMEIVQIFVPSREPGFSDIGINTMGAALGFAVYRLWIFSRRRRLRAR